MLQQRSDSSPLSGPGSERPARAPAIAPELTPAERAAALSRLGGATLAGEPFRAERLDAVRDRLQPTRTLRGPERRFTASI